METPQVPRSMRGPVVFAAVFIVAAGAVLARRDAATIRMIVTGIMGGLFAVGAVLSIARARETPAERRGWILIGTSRALMTLSGLSLLAFRVSCWPMNISLAATVFENALVAAGLWSWPWHQDRPVRRVPHVLGSMLFIGSLILFLWLAG